MKRIVLSDLPLRPRNPFAGISGRVHSVLLVLFLAQWGFVWLRTCFGDERPVPGQWPYGLLAILAAAATLAGLCRELPGQSVMLAATMIAGLSGAAQSLGAVTGVPFGPYAYTDRIGQQLFYPLPWAVPLLWVILLVNARGTSRLILQPWRGAKNHGFWVLGLSVGLVVLAEAGLEPFAAGVKGYWKWENTRIPSDWYGTPWVNFLGWTVTALVILAFATPALIDKRPGPRPPPWHPLLVWVPINTLLLTSAVAHRQTAAATLIAGQTILATGFALYGVRAGRCRDPMTR